MSLLIKSVRVLVGEKDINESFDVLVNAGKISAIGNFPNKKAYEVVDGQGAYLAPGFIDVDTTSDHHLTLFDDPEQEDFLAQGVTTIIGGQCGASLAPLISGNLESMRKWADINSVNVNWHSLKELFYHLDKRPIGVNFGTLTGHSTIRRSLTRGVFRDLTVPEAETFSHILGESLKEGSFGMSLGLSYSHTKGTSLHEIIGLAKTVKKNGRILAVHLRKSDDGLEESVKEAIRISQETGVKTFINHLVPLKGNESQYKKVLELISGLPEDSQFYFGVFPLPTTSIALYSFLPDWARGNFEKMAALVRDKANEERLLKGFKEFTGKNLVVAQALRDNSLVGKNLQEIMRMYSLPNIKKALLKLMQTTGLRAVLHHKNLNSKLIADAVKHPRSLITSHAPSIKDDKNNFLKADRSISTFTEYLKLAGKDKSQDIESAVKKITLLPARIYGIQGRGEVKEGNYADLTLFRGSEIKCVIVNGEIAWKDGSPTGKMKGKILRHADI